MSLYPLAPQLLMIDLDDPTYRVCIKAGSLAGLRPLYMTSNSPLHPRAKSLSAVVLDAQMCADTFKAVARVQEVLPELPLVVVTARGSDAQSRLALRLGASHAVKKPCDPAELEKIFRFIVETRAAREQNGALPLRPETLASSIEPPIPVICARCAMQFFAGEQHGSISQIEKDAVLAAVKAADGDKVRAAEMLGIGKTTLYRKLQSYRQEEQSPIKAS